MSEVKIIFKRPSQSDKDDDTYIGFASNIPRKDEMVDIPGFWTGCVKDIHYVYSRFGGWEHVVIELRW